MLHYGFIVADAESIYNVSMANNYNSIRSKFM